MINNNLDTKQKFISRILKEEGDNIDKAQQQVMAAAGFKSRFFFQNRSFDVSDTNLIFQHTPQHRFVDMGTRQTKEGKKKKVAHPIHNAILYGHANTIVSRLSFGYTDEMITLLKKEEENL